MTEEIERRSIRETIREDGLGNFIKAQVPYLLSDSTALVTIGNPYRAVVEIASGMSPEQSLDSRLLATAATYGGFGLSVRLRDASLHFVDKLCKKKFDLEIKDSPRWRKIHDSSISAAVLVGLSVPIYYHVGADAKTIAMATAGSLGAGAALGGVGGYLIDSYRAIFGIEGKDKIPTFLKDKNPIVQKGFVAGTFIASSAAVGGIYLLAHQVQQYF